MEAINFQNLCSRLTAVYDQREARALLYIYIEDVFGWNRTDVCMGALDSLSDKGRERLESDLQRLEKGEPLQYVTGIARFRNRDFHVEQGVLIPRPETEELVGLAIDNCPKKALRRGARCLDIGTGSGCIAISMALEIPGAAITAWDISDSALRIASANAERLGAPVTFQKKNALSLQDEVTEPQWDCIVSNPPYVCQSEKKDMDINVLNHEPHLALFVDDADPLIFYRHIGRYAIRNLSPQGILLYEINERYGQETADMLKSLGFKKAQIIKDQFSKPRFIKVSL